MTQGRGLTRFAIACVVTGALSSGGSRDRTVAAVEIGGPEAQPQCRNLATSLTHVTTGAGGYSSTLNQTCTFDRAALSGSCTHEISDNRGMSIVTSTRVTATYASIDDFFDEVRVIPPLVKVQSATATATGPAGQTSKTTYEYDSQGRLTREVTTGPARTSETRYTEWDAAGRPTRIRDVGPGFANTRVIRHDDAQRTRTTSVIPDAQGQVVLVTVETFDANGLPIRQQVGSGASASTTTITVKATRQICR